MKNLITVNNFTTRRNRIYEIPENILIVSGQIVEVECTIGGRAIGRAVTDSFQIEDEAAAIIRSSIGLDPDGNFKKVTARYEENWTAGGAA